MERTSTGAGQELASVEQSLESTVKRYNEVLTRFDAKEAAKFWADDGTLLTPFGSFGKGRSGVERVFGQDAPKLFEGAKIALSIVGARKIRDDCVLLDLDIDAQNFKRPDGSRGPAKLHNVILAQRKGEGWQWLDVRPYAFLERPAVH
jgi:uncharacterized protein (TIGR02246 family)